MLSWLCFEGVEKCSRQDLWSGCSMRGLKDAYEGGFLDLLVDPISDFV
jgi:hypothetical protein